MGKPVVAHDGVGDVIENIDVAVFLNGKDAVRKLPQRILDYNDAHSSSWLPQLAQRVVLDDGIVLTIAGFPDEFRWNSPVVFLAPVLDVRYVRITIPEGIDEAEPLHSRKLPCFAEKGSRSFTKPEIAPGSFKNAVCPVAVLHGNPLPEDLHGALKGNSSE